MTEEVKKELVKIYPRSIDKDRYLERVTGPRGGNRSYKLYDSNDETVFPSVTTVLGSLSKPAIPNWYAKKVAEKAGEHWKNEYKPRHDTPVEDFIKDIKSAPREEFMRAGKIGTEAHDCINRIIQNKMDDGYGSFREVGKYITDDFDFNYDEAKNAVNSWIEWVSNPNRNFSFLESEFGTYHKSDDQYVRYAGTVDAIASLPDGDLPTLVVFDWKTGSDIYAESGLQISAYCNSIWMGSDWSAIRTKYQRIIGCIVKLGTTEHPDNKVKFVRDWRLGYNTFKALTEVHLDMLMQSNTLLTGNIGEVLTR